MADRAARVLRLLPLAVVALFLASLLASTSGHFVPQVVDLYLVCQYARALADGHPFHYNAGEPASTGATSLLHTVMLAVADRLGVRGEWLVAFAILAGAVFYLASVRLAAGLAERLAGPREGFLAGALVALGGPVVWAFMYGSDTGLFMLLSLVFLAAFVTAAAGGAIRGMVVAGVLLALTRPEAIVLCATVALGWSLGAGRGQALRRRAAAWLPVAAGLSVLALYKALTGQWLGSSVVDKSLWASYGWREGLALVSEYLVDVVRGLLLGFYPSAAAVGFAKGWAALYFPPLGLLAVLAGLAAIPGPGRAPLAWWAAGVAASIVLFSPNVFMGVHFNRHVLWALPSLLVLAAIGAGHAARLLARGDEQLERRLFGGVAGLWLGLGLLATLRFATLYGEMAGEVFRRDVQAAQWIERNLPKGVAMANLATSVEYLTGHRNLNLHGVTSPAFFGNSSVEREAGVFEALGRLPVAERPEYLITSVGTQETSAAFAELVEQPPLFRTLSLGDEILIHRLRWELADRNRQLWLPETREAMAGRAEVDRLNVCDRRDESAHAYEFGSALGDLALYGSARVGVYPGPPAQTVIDAGRVIFGHEAFDVRARPGQDLLIVLRTAVDARAQVRRAEGSGAFPFEIAQARLAVTADGEPAGDWTFAPRSGWDERVFRIAGSAIRRERPRLVFSGRYAAYHYWFFQ